MTTLPFSSDKALFVDLKNKYLLNGLKWMGDFRDPNSKGLLGMKTGSLWGVGYGLQCLIYARPLFLHDGDFPGDFDEKAYVAINHLAQKASFGETTCSWDGNIWDTAVICRALLVCLIEYPEYSRQNNVLQVCTNSLRWLITQIENWRLLRYAQGMPDLAQILKTFLRAVEIIPNEFNTLLKSNQSELIIDELVDEIIHLAEKKCELYNGHSETIVTWEDDIFSTADAIICLARFLKSPKYTKNSRTSAIQDLISYALRYLELEQVDGKWGIEETTAVGLRAYVVGYDALGNGKQPEPHIIFKALRHLCDPKIVFSDGSIAHEMEPTVYYLLAIMDIINKWKIPNGLTTSQPILELYDYIIWNTPTRSTHERVLRLSAETQRDQLKAANELLEVNLLHKQKQIKAWRTSLFIVVWCIIGVITSSWLGVGEDKPLLVPILNIVVKDWQAFLAFLTLLGGVAFFFYERVLRWSDKL